MIREYAPIGLIPAAWVMTFLTVVHPEIDSYWIRHMHYFMLLFLAGFTLLSWTRMGEDRVLDIWRRVIAAGVLVTGLGALSFSVEPYSRVTAGVSLGYWLVAPGVGCYLSAKQMDTHSRAYRAVGSLGATALILSGAGLAAGLDAVTALGFSVAAGSQTYSIFIAARMDGNI
jgi:hypothetical protein